MREELSLFRGTLDDGFWDGLFGLVDDGFFGLFGLLGE